MSSDKLPRHKYVGFMYDRSGKCHPVMANTLNELQHRIDVEINNRPIIEDTDEAPWCYVVEAGREVPLELKVRLQILEDK